MTEMRSAITGWARSKTRSAGKSSLNTGSDGLASGAVPPEHCSRGWHSEQAQGCLSTPYVDQMPRSFLLTFIIHELRPRSPETVLGRCAT
jgi:hypothetical protein